MPEYYIAKADIKTPRLPADLHRVEDRQAGYSFVDEPSTNKERYIRQLQAMTGIDRMLGKVRDQLKKLNLAENTIIIFTSDHGLFMGEFGLGGKALCYEKTTHVPLIVYDPNLPKKQKGTTNTALVQSIDIAPTLLSKAKIEIPNTYQGKDLSTLLDGRSTQVRDYIFTENLWSTHFGNPRCEAIQDKEWKYIRYYRNDNLSATKKIELAKQLGIKVGQMLYGVHDADIARYRHYIESPLEGEVAVYEELFHLKNDPKEVYNLAQNVKHKKQLERLRAAWKVALVEARGKGAPNVLRYTLDSQMEGKQGGIRIE